MGDHHQSYYQISLSGRSHRAIILRGEEDAEGWLVVRASGGKVAKIFPSDAWLQNRSTSDEPQIHSKKLTRERKALTALALGSFVPRIYAREQTCRWTPWDPKCLDRPAIVMEDVGDTDLRDHIEQLWNTRTNDVQFASCVRALVVDLYQAMQTFHNKGFRHRDLKHTHIRVIAGPGEKERRRICIIDWANAQDISDPLTPPERVYPNGPGTKGFMSPRAQTGPLTNYSKGDDVFALAAALFYSITGEEIPLDSCDSWYTPGSNGDEREAKVFYQRARLNLKAKLDTDTKLIEVLARSLSLNHSRRYQTADEVLKELQAGTALEGLSGIRSITGSLRAASASVASRHGFSEGLPAALVVMIAWVAMASSSQMAAFGLLLAFLTFAIFTQVGEDISPVVPRLATPLSLLALLAVRMLGQHEPCLTGLLFRPFILASVACAAPDIRTYRWLMALALTPTLVNYNWTSPMMLAIPIIIGISAGSAFWAGTGGALVFFMTTWALSVPPTVYWGCVSEVLPVTGLWGTTSNSGCALHNLIAVNVSLLAIPQLILWVAAAWIAYQLGENNHRDKIMAWGVASALLLGGTLVSLLLVRQFHPVEFYLALIAAPGLAWFFVAESTD